MGKNNKKRETLKSRKKDNKKRNKRKRLRKEKIRTNEVDIFGFPIKVHQAFRIWQYANENRKQQSFIDLIRNKKRLADIRKKFQFQKRVAQGEMCSFEKVLRVYGRYLSIMPLTKVEGFKAHHAFKRNLNQNNSNVTKWEKFMKEYPEMVNECEEFFQSFCIPKIKAEYGIH